MNLFRLIQRLRLDAPHPDTEVAADVTSVSDLPAPQLSDEIRRRQMALLERYVMVSRSYRRNS